ncbi:type IV pilus biogenesis protein PilM [Halomonas sp. AOP12-C2-37]|uniref:Type IV pilus assembly protein PilM n=1 Tax=Halomonas casei TaxID=2742613 RepID=A0ABR9F1B2_9GAMM|nr:MULTISPECIES: type IV pilus assembly protein PilM [Halomonas]MBE0399919.1 type IV pilus assembly protein PilM [Halomonas casei]PCC23528.1 pilus assembly protein PilM [Halomonas sp. JB37]
MRFMKSDKGLIGIDITSASVKLLELAQCRGSYQVVSYAVKPLRESTIIERRIRDINDVTSTLKRALDHAQPHTRQAAVAIPASAAITKTLSFPIELREDEIEERIMAEYDRHVPFPFNDVAFDFKCQGPAPLDEGQQQVGLVACRQRDVIQLAETLERVGLEPAVVDVDTFALARSLGELRGQAHAGDSAGDAGVACIGVVDIDAATHVFHVLHGQHVVYSRSTAFDDRPLTSPLLEAIAQQVMRALQRYHIKAHQQPIQHIVLAGVSSVMPGLAERIANHSGTPVTIANPFQHMQVNKRLNLQALMNDAPTMLTAGGLAMRVNQ